MHRVTTSFMAGLSGVSPSAWAWPAAAIFFYMHASLATSPIVLFDSGEAVPAAQHLSSLFAAEEGAPPGLALVSFPVHTRSMTSGVLDTPSTLKRPAWLAQPVFLLGPDRRSRQWLNQYQDTLRNIQAQGIVVQADSFSVVRELQALSGLPLVPASMDGAAEQWGLRVYPVLIQMGGTIVQEMDRER